MKPPRAPLGCAAVTLALLAFGTPLAPQSSRFTRADANADERLDISDPIFVLGFLFLGSPAELDCHDAADANDDGNLDLSDAVYALAFLFTGGPVPPAPFPECGIDNTDDPLGCTAHSPCPDVEPGVPPAPLVEPFPSPTRATTVRLRGTAEGAARVEVQGGVAIVDGTPDADGRFELEIDLQRDRTNRLFVTAIGASGERSPPAALHVIQDTQPPSLFVDTPADDVAVTSPAVTVAGRVGDVLSGFLGLEVTVGGSPADVVRGIGTNGSFERPGVQLAVGPNEIEVHAMDAAGNIASRTVRVVREEAPPGSDRLEVLEGDNQHAPTGEELPGPLVVQVVSSAGDPLPGRTVRFRVTRSDGRLATSSGAPPSELVRELSVETGAAGEARAWWRLGSDAGCGNQRVVAMSEGAWGRRVFCASADPGPPDRILIGMGDNQRIEAGSVAPEQLRVFVSDGVNGVGGVPVTFTVTAGDAAVEGASSTVLETQPTGHACVEVAAGTSPVALVEADFDGNPGEPAVFTLYAVERDEEAPTRFEGFVLDNGREPLGDATCRLSIGDTEVEPITSAEDGAFVFDDLPGSGPAVLHVNGLTATTRSGEPVPQGSFPALRYEVVLVPGAENRLPAPVLLPELDPDNARAYSTTGDTVLTAEGIEGLRMRIAAGSMSIGGEPAADGEVVSLNPVHVDDIPMPFPDGAAAPFAWTLQPAGAHFDPPVEITYPNMSGLPPGAIAYFMSFNHDTERFEIVASASVTEDGSTLLSDPGMGIRVAGWGGSCPPYPPVATIRNICEEGAGLFVDLYCEPCDEDVPVCGANAPVPIDTTTLWDTVDGGDGPGASVPRLQWEHALCRDGDRIRVRMTVLRTSGIIRLARDTYTEPVPGPDGNVTASNYCEVLADLESPTTSDWEVPEAVRTHEEYHRDVDHPRLLQPLWDDVEARLERLSVSCRYTPAQAEGILGPIVDDVMQQLQVNFHAELATFGKQHNQPPFDDGAFQADRVPTQQRIEEVRSWGQSQGFGPCPQPVVDGRGAGDAPILVDLIAEPAETVLDPGGEVALSVEGVFSDGSRQDVTGTASGIEYASSDPAVAAVDADGRVTAEGSGLAVLTVALSPPPPADLAVAASVRIVVVSPDDGDGDFLPDDWETAFGLDPEDRSDAGLDPDFDGLSSLAEHRSATDPLEADTDGDGLDDGTEIDIGLDPRNAGTLGEDWSVSAGGRTVSAGPGGLFSLGNIPLVDQMPADGVSDLPLRITAVGEHDGRTFHAISQPVQPREDEPFGLTRFSFSTDATPLAQSVRVEAREPVLELGESTLVEVFAVARDGSERDVTGAGNGATYATSNAGIARIDGDGNVTGEALGTAFITARFEGSTGVERIDVVEAALDITVEGTLRTGDGTPLADVVLESPAGAVDVDLAPDGSFSVRVEGLPPDRDIALTFRAEIDGVGYTARVELGRPAGGETAILGEVVLEPSAAGPLFSSPAFFFAPADGFSSASSITLADTGADGTPEAVVTAITVPPESTGYVSIHRLRDDGTFTGGDRRLATANRLLSVATSADVDGDGDTDLAFIASGVPPTPPSVVTLESDGSGGLAEGPSAPFTGTPSPGETSRLAATDIDGDGRDELMAGTLLGLEVFELDDAGTLVSRGVPVGFPLALPLVVRDDGEGLEVAAVRCCGFPTNTVAVLGGDGAGGFGAPDEFPFTDDITPSASAFHAADLDGDTAVDSIVSFRGQTNGDVVLAGDGEGGFGEPSPLDLGGTALATATGDMDADGDPDVVAAIGGEDGAPGRIVAADDSGATASDLVTGYSAARLASGDLDGDGRQDLLLAMGSGLGTALLNDADTGFGARQPVVGPFPFRVEVADLDGDGARDLVSVSALGDGVSVLLGDGDGGFAGEVRHELTGEGPVCLRAADWDGDGIPDIVAGFPDSLAVLPGKGGAVFGNATSFATNGFCAGLVDLEGDGRVEALVSTETGALEVLTAAESGGVDTRGLAPAGERFGRAVTRDLDGDGLRDLAVLAAPLDAKGDDGAVAATVRVLWADGGGDFASSPPLLDDPGLELLTLAAGDVDLDGELDLVTTGASGSLYVLSNTGEGGFLALPPVEVPFAASAAAVADLDLDGAADVALTARAGAAAAVLLNDGSGVLDAARLFGVPFGPFDLEAADLDGDGDPDLVLGSGAPALSLLENRTR